MSLKSLFTCIILMFVSIAPAFPRSTTSISNGIKVTTTDNVTRNGKAGILFKIAMTVPGPEPDGALIIANICDMQSKKVYVNGSALGTYGSISIPYKNNAFDNCELFISYDELKKGNISKTSPFKYYITIKSKSKSNRQLKQTGYLEWKGSSSKPTPAPAPNKPKASENKSWVEKFGTMTVHHTLFPDGTENITTQIPCIFCHETGLCQACYGSGQIYWPGLGCFQPCGMCYGKKACTQCGGSKKHSTTIFRKPDGLYYDTSGRLIATPSPEIIGKDYKVNGVCPVCHGTGVQDFPMYEDDPTGASINVIAAHELGYQHTGGGACRYCGKYNYHVHLKCYKCN